MKNRALFIFVLFVLLIWTLAASAGQIQPDVKRVHEIQAALIAHGCEPGKSWESTQDILRGIARDHDWQTHHAPDARVLILLGLGNKFSNPAVTTEGRNHLDGEPRDKKTRAKKLAQ